MNFGCVCVCLFLPVHAYYSHAIFYRKFIHLFVRWWICSARKVAADGWVSLWLSRCEIHLVWLRLSRNGPSFDIEIYVNSRMRNRNSREFSGCNIFGVERISYRTWKSVLLPDEISSKHTYNRKLCLAHKHTHIIYTQVGGCVFYAIFAKLWCHPSWY